MKKTTLFVYLLLVTTLSKAQDIDVLLTAGVENAERFANDYLASGTNGLIHSMNANWFNTADAKPLGAFEISIIANAALINDEQKSFAMNIADYNQPGQDFEFAFSDGVNSKNVATALGENNPGVDVDIIYDDDLLGEISETITLPTGIGSGTANLLPMAFIQGAVGLVKGIEVKVRFVPKIDVDDVEIGMFGAGVQFEATKWLPADKLLPFAISGLIAYTGLNGAYDLTETSGIEGSNQRLESKTSSWLLQLIASTKMPVINFYGGLGYISGKSNSDLLGTYTISSGPFFSETVTNPFSVSSKVSDVRATVGFKLKLGFFRFNGEYHLSKFDAFSLGVNFGFR